MKIGKVIDWIENIIFVVLLIATMSIGFYELIDHIVDKPLEVVVVYEQDDVLSEEIGE